MPLQYDKPVKIDARSHEILKAKAAEEGTSMSYLLKQLIRGIEPTD